MTDYVFSDIASNKSIRVRPSPGDEEHYIGLEHMSADSFEVDSYGSETELKGDKLAMSKGDLLFGRRRAYQRKVSIAPFDGIFSAHGMILEPNEKVVDKRFFPFFIRSDYFMDRAISLSVGSLSPTLNWSDIKKETFNLPDLQFQRDAAEVLWKLEELKKLLTHHLSVLDVLIKSRFIEMFGNDTSNYPEVTIYDMLSNVSGGGTPSKSHPEYYGGDIPWVTSKDVKQFYIDDSVIHITEEGLNNSSAKMIPANSIILVVRSGILKHTLPVSVSTRPVSINQDLKGLEVKSDVNPIYLAYALKRMETKIIGESRATTVDNVEIKRILNFLIPKPPYEIQNQFADFVRQVDKSKEVLLKHIEDTKSLQQSIINSCFEANEDV